MFGEVPHTPQDVHFQVFGIPCRIHPFFWLAGVFFALPQQRGLPGGLILALLLSRIACLFISILVHELGHAVLIRWAGYRPEIVLHAFGGYALSAYRTVRPAVSVAISFAGPAAGFLLYLVVRVVAIQINAAYGERVPIVLRDAIVQLEYINLVWGLVNLLPIYPLDGGQITRTLLQSRWGLGGLRTSMVISILASGLTAITLYQTFHYPLLSFPVMLFGILCFESVQAYQGLGYGPRR